MAAIECSRRMRVATSAMGAKSRNRPHSGEDRQAVSTMSAICSLVGGRGCGRFFGGGFTDDIGL
jgi:hypothetical protein